MTYCILVDNNEHDTFDLSRNGAFSLFDISSVIAFLESVNQKWLADDGVAFLV